MPSHNETDDIPFLIVDLARLLRAEFERQVGEAGLSITAGEARILFHLERCGPIRQQPLAERLGISKMSLTNYIDRLEKAHLVARSDDLQDRRAKLVSITSNADPILKEMHHIRKVVGLTTRGAIDEAEWARLAEVLRQTRSNLVAVRRPNDRDGAK